MILRPCRRVDRALAAGEPLSGGLARHAEECSRCGERIEGFRAVEEAAPALRASWETPDLLPRILAALDAPAAQPAPAEEPPRRPLSPWLVAAYAAGLVLLSTVGLWVFRDTPGRNPFSGGGAAESPFLSENAMKDVERKEADYVAAIDRLDAVARARPAPESALAASYHEKLQLIDSAIADCRAQIEQNRYNAHLRHELLAMYGEKKRTLEDLVKEVKS